MTLSPSSFVHLFVIRGEENQNSMPLFSSNFFTNWTQTRKNKTKEDGREQWKKMQDIEVHPWLLGSFEWLI